MPGPMNRNITLEHMATTRDLKYGSWVSTWVKVHRVWAELVEQKPSERYLEGSKRVKNQSKRLYRIHARSDVDETMRVIDEYGVAWDVAGIIKNDLRYLTLQLQHLA